MSCHGNNATAPAPAIAPGAHGLDPRRIAEDLVARHGPGGMDLRVRALIPAFDAPFCQAGLAGYSDAPMRLVARSVGCPFCVTEALLDRTLLAGGRGYAKADLGDLADNVPGGADDHPLAGQIMGSEPAEMAAAALKMAEQAARPDRSYRDLAYTNPHLHVPRTHADFRQQLASTARPDASVPHASMPLSFESIDVNLACPVKKIAKKARGGHWLANPEGAIAILEAVREAVPATMPTTVKMRRAFDETDEMRENFLRIFDAAYDMGYAWVTVHGRTVEQKYIGPSRWEPIAELTRRHPDRIVLGSGDVWSVADIFRMIAFAGVSAVSVARGCIGNPWIFREARELLEGREPTPPTIAEQRQVLETHFALALKANHLSRRPETLTGRTMRKFGIRFAAHHPEPEAVKQRMIKVENTDDWRAVLDECYARDDSARSAI
ncbi:MAG: tRNA-dihydrouridine synthase family protein [Planctomycetota bacterium]